MIHVYATPSCIYCGDPEGEICSICGLDPFKSLRDEEIDAEADAIDILTDQFGVYVGADNFYDLEMEAEQLHSEIIWNEEPVGPSLWNEPDGA